MNHITKKTLLQCESLNYSTISPKKKIDLINLKVTAEWQLYGATKTDIFKQL